MVTKPQLTLCRIRFLSAAIALLFFGQVSAAEKVNAKNSIAMDGFDVVAYFEQDKAIKGDTQFSVDYKGERWVFSSQQNADAFSQNPTTFEPQFNGWCAYAVSEGYSAEVDFVDGWAVLDDKLYLNWDKGVRDTFIEEQQQRKADAANNWAEVHAGMLDGSGDFYTHEQEDVDISHPQEPKIK